PACRESEHRTRDYHERHRVAYPGAQTGPPFEEADHSMPLEKVSVRANFQLVVPYRHSLPASEGFHVQLATTAANGDGAVGPGAEVPGAAGGIRVRPQRRAARQALTRNDDLGPGPQREIGPVDQLQLIAGPAAVVR